MAVIHPTNQLWLQLGIPQSWARESLARYWVARLCRVLVTMTALVVLFKNLQVLSSSPTSRIPQKPASRGAVVSESALCSRHGADMIKMGGNAADAV